MPIEVQHQPSLNLIGQTANETGQRRANYQEVIRQDQQRLNYEQLRQRDRMQVRDMEFRGEQAQYQRAVGLEQLQSRAALGEQQAIREDSRRRELATFALNEEGLAKKKSFQAIRDKITKQEANGELHPWQAKLAHMQNDGNEQNVDYMSMRDPNANAEEAYNNQGFRGKNGGWVVRGEDGKYNEVEKPQSGRMTGESEQQWIKRRKVYERNADGEIIREGTLDIDGKVDWYDPPEQGFVIPQSPEEKRQYVKDHIIEIDGVKYWQEDDGGVPKRLEHPKEEDDEVYTPEAHGKRRSEAIKSISSKNKQKDEDGNDAVITEQDILDEMKLIDDYYKKAREASNKAKPIQQATPKEVTLESLRQPDGSYPPPQDRQQAELYTDRIRSIQNSADLNDQAEWQQLMIAIDALQPQE